MTVPTIDASIPTVLHNPPWARDERAPQPPRIALPPYVQAPTLHWPEDERERALAPYASSSYLPCVARPEDHDARMTSLGLRVESYERLLAGEALRHEDFVEWPPPRSRPPWLYSLFYLPNAVALAVWNGMPTTSWSGASDGELLGVVLRHGIASAPGWIAYAAQRPVQGLRIARWFDAPELAAAAMHAMRGTKLARQSGSTWLLAHPDTTAEVLLRSLFGNDDDARDDARATLHAVAHKGLQTALDRAAARLGAEVVAGLQQQLDADPLLLLPARMPKLPAFFDPARLHRPRLLADGAALPDDAMRNLGLMLAISKPEQPYAGLDAARAACTGPSLAEFAWTLFEAWWAADAPSKDAWCFAAITHFIDDSIAHRLGARAMRMAKEGAKNRAQSAVDMLADFGSDTALMHLNNLVERCKVPAVRNRAAAKIDAVTQARGLTRLDLADRLVPTLGLDDSRTLDFGTRQFEIAFDETLAPFVRDAQGARLKDLPKPRLNDDTAKAQAATLRWKQLKKDIKTLARVQIARLERAMVDQRTWPHDEFQRFFVAHPIVRELAARLLWGVFDAQARVVDALRIAEDGSLADAKDHRYEVPAGVRLGIVHPLLLPAPLKAVFGGVFGDYELLQPFPQLMREVYTLEPTDATATTLAHFEGREVATGAVIGLLDRGWLRGPAEERGMINRIECPLGKGDITARLNLEPGMFVGQLSSEPRQTLGVLALVDGENKPARFTDADPLACSEVLRDLYRLTPSALTTP